MHDCHDYERRWSHPDEPPPRDYGFDADPIAWAVSPDFLVNHGPDRASKRRRSATRTRARWRGRALLLLARLSVGGAIIAVCAWNLALHGLGIQVDASLDALIGLGGGCATFVALGNTLDLFDDDWRP